MDDRRPSKTQRKKAVHELRDLGVELVELSDERLAAIELPERLRDAVTDARRITAHGARRRQMQYIGKIMRDLDAGPIAAQLEQMHAPSRAQTAVFHRAEEWRTEILADAEALARFVQEFPEADAHELRALVGKANDEREAGKAPKFFRKLFHAINKILQDHHARNK